MKKVKGSSIKLKSDVNISADKVLLKGKKSKTYEELKEPYKDMSKDFERLLPMMLGAMPVMAGVPSEKDKLMLKLMGSLAACAGVKIIKNQDGSYSAVYTGALNRVRNNAVPAVLELSDVQLKEEIYKIISKMLEKNGPAFASWNELLKDLMKNNSMEDFLKGARGALCAMTGDPVNANTGNFTYSKEDIMLRSKFPIGFIRSYNSSEKSPLNTNIKYKDVTSEWKKVKENEVKDVKDLAEWKHNGEVYKVDGKHVVLDYKKEEFNIAKIIAEKYGKEVFMVPRVNEPAGISTPDYRINGENYDLKTISKDATNNTIFNRIQKAKKQSNNFILDLSNCTLDDSIIQSQIEKIYTSIGTKHANKVVLIKDSDVIKAFIKK